MTINAARDKSAKAIYEVFRADGRDMGMASWPDWGDAPEDIRWLVIDAAEAAGVCPFGPTEDHRWPISENVIDAGVRAYTEWYGKHGLRETLMHVWNAMHRARSDE